MLTALREAIWEWLPEPFRSAVRIGQIALGPVLFAGGFAWDALTLDRIDRWLDNALLGAYLVLLGVAAVLDHRAQDERLPAWMMRWPWLYGLAVHFFFGGLFSAYVVYYLKSATFGRTLGFLAFLAGLLVANEFLQRWVKGSWIRLQLYLVCAFSFLMFWIPVATGLLGRVVWVLAAAGAFVATAAVFIAMDAGPDRLTATAVDRIKRDPVARLKWQFKPTVRYGSAALSWAGTLGVLLILDLAGMIPPVPISVLHTGIYREVKPAAGQVTLSYERVPWWRFWKHDDSRWRLRDGDRVCIFAPVFAPTGVHPRLYHRWERWDPDQRTWQWTKDRGTWIQATGGRDTGSPHFTCKRNGLRPGPWRVTIETEDQRVVAWHAFDLVAADPDDELELTTTVWK